MIIGIDASNIRSGGGITHLVELLSRSDPKKHQFEKILIWSSEKTLEYVPDKPWISKKSNKYLNRSVYHSLFWKLYKRDKEIQLEKCDILFLVDPTSSRFHTNILILHNILPFVPEAVSLF